MAHALGSLDPSICDHLEEAEDLLLDRTVSDILSDVLIKHGLLKERYWIDKNIVGIVL